jgi:hypothetical protein
MERLASMPWKMAAKSSRPHRLACAANLLLIVPGILRDDDPLAF